jgi:hypothetical protein
MRSAPELLAMSTAVRAIVRLLVMDTTAFLKLKIPELCITTLHNVYSKINIKI